MKNIAVTAVLGLASMAMAGPCDNNCGRQVIGTARKSPALTDRQAQCSEFLTSTTTVTPPTATVTIAPIYQRNVHGPRAVAPALTLTGDKPAYASSCPDITAYWNACQCFDGLTPTLVTVTAATPTTTLLGPTCTQGLEHALYAPLPGTPQRAALDRADLDLSLLVAGQVPAATGVAVYIPRINNDGPENSPIEVYGITGPEGSWRSKTVIDHRGYLVPATAGRYVVSLPDSDDVTYLWVGEAAVDGFGKGNAQLTQSYGQRPGGTYVIDVAEGDVGTPIAVRLLWINYTGRGVFEASIKAPDNKVILGFGSVKNEQILAGCSGPRPVVPEWAAWEDETVVGSGQTQ